MENSRRTMQQSQLLSNISKDTKFPIETVKCILDSYEKETKEAIMNNMKVPLPGAMGYIEATITTTKVRKTLIKLTNKEATISPRLKMITAFSKPWRSFLNSDSRAEKLIEILIICKENKLRLKNKQSLIKSKTK